MTTQFWKGLLMALVGVVVAGFSTTPLSWGVIIVTMIATSLTYFGTNAIPKLRPVSIPTTLSGRDIVAALLISIGNTITNSIGLIVIGTEISEINWLLMGKIALSVALTYLGSTLFAGPYSTRKVDWSYKARVAYSKKMGPYEN